jgi:hypothetical protein
VLRKLVKYEPEGATRSAVRDRRSVVIAADAARLCYSMPVIPDLQQFTQQRRVEEIRLQMRAAHRAMLDLMQARDRARNFDEEWFRLCVHEMAHAHVAHSFGAASAEIRINGGLRGGGHTCFCGLNLAATAAVAMAGGIAERLVFGTAEGCRGDRATLAECVEALGWDEDDARIQILRRITKRIVEAGLVEIVRGAEKLTRPGNYSVRWSN